MPWPAVGFGGIRLWDTGTNWYLLNPSRGVYNWTTLDSWLDLAQSRGVDVLYTFGNTPTWASSNPTGTCDRNPGGCSSPANMQDWDDFVRAIATHSAGRIKYWELWNEPNEINQFWDGDIPSLVIMAQHAYSIIKSIDPTATVLTPGAFDGSISTWLGQYFAAGGGTAADGVAFHGYPTSRPVSPEQINGVIDAVMATMASYGQSSKPIWDTESSWGLDTNLPNLDDEAAYVARSYILHWSRGVARFYWYAWNNTLWGTLWDMSTNTLLEPGIAYGEVYKWLAGATMSTPCSMAGDSTWTCILTRPDGYEAEIVWNTSVTSPGTLSFTPGGQFAQYRDLSGNVVPITDAAVQIGGKPILLEQFEAASLSQSSLNFISLAPGTNARSQAITISNVGGAPLLMLSFGTSGSFEQTNTCGTSIAVGGSCTITVTPTLASSALQSGAISITDNAPDSPQIVSLNSSVGPQVTMSPTSLSFSGEIVGAKGSAHVVTLTNTGTKRVTMGRVAIEGTDGDDFKVSGNTCGKALDAGANCKISINFTPGAPWSRRATLNVDDNLPGSPQTISLEGMGTDFSLSAESDASPAALVTAGQNVVYNLQIVPLGGFTGLLNVSVNCGNVPAESSCVATPGSVTLNGATSVPFTVNIATTVQPPQLAAQTVLPWLFLVLFVGEILLRQRRLRDRLVFSTALLFLLLIGCAAVGGNTVGVSSTQGTPSGMHSIVITGSAQGVNRSINLTLAVK